LLVILILLSQCSWPQCAFVLRMDDADKHPEKSIPWAEVEARLKARFGD
jgi:hypothetical protein